MSYYPDNYQDWRNFDDFRAAALERMNEIEVRAIQRTIENATPAERIAMTRDRVLAKAENVARDHDHAEVLQ